MTFLLFGSFVVLLTIVAATTLTWTLFAWRTPEQLDGTRFPRLRPARHSFSLIVPARHEEAVLLRTLGRMADADHPDVEVLVVVGHDDDRTARIAHEAAARSPRVRVVVDEGWPKSKPKALNTALPYCQGDVVGVFDAEDDVHPELLAHVDSLFQSSGADVVQSGVQLMNYWSNWYSVHNVLEYYFWFRSRLHFHAAARFIPLGGNTVFVRTDVLRAEGGWDDACLAEDCDVGVRLSSGGHRVAVAYDPRLVTREETPPSVGALLKQRTRWNQGFLQVLRKGDWRRLPTFRQRALALYTLAMPFLQAFAGALVPASVATALLLTVPLPLALLSFLPLVPTAVILAVQLVGLSEFCRTYGRPARVRDYARLLLGAGPYQVLLAGAALRAVWRELRGQRGWEKTQHLGAHLQPSTEHLRSAA